MTVLQQLEAMQLAQRVVKGNQPQQQVVGPRTELTGLHNPRNRGFHIKGESGCTATYISDDGRDRVLRGPQLIQTCRRVSIVTVGEVYLIKLCIVEYWHFNLLSSGKKLSGG